MSYVYLITSASGKAVKIGIADSPKQRLVALQTANHEELRIYCAFQCESRSKAIQLETLLHEKYAHCRLKGEWFYIAPEKIVADVLSNERLMAFILSYQVHKVGMLEMISNILATKLATINRGNEQIKDKASEYRNATYEGTQGQEFLMVFGLILGIILLMSFGSLISGLVSMEIIGLLITLGFSFAILFAIVLAVEILQRVG